MLLEFRFRPAVRADGTPVSLVVDAAKLKASVHPDHACVDQRIQIAVSIVIPWNGQIGGHPPHDIGSCQAALR